MQADTETGLELWKGHGVFSQLWEKVIRHQLEWSVVLANKKWKQGCTGQDGIEGEGAHWAVWSDKEKFGLDADMNTDGTSAITNISLH